MARKLIWVGSSLKDFSTFPLEVRDDMLAALDIAREGGKAASAKPLQGFSGASVLEIVEGDPSGTYRCMYTVKFRTGIYVLHAFQKKSKTGIKTPQSDIDLIRRRYNVAVEKAREEKNERRKD